MASACSSLHVIPPLGSENFSSYLATPCILCSDSPWMPLHLGTLPYIPHTAGPNPNSSCGLQVHRGLPSASFLNTPPPHMVIPSALAACRLSPLLRHLAQLPLLWEAPCLPQGHCVSSFQGSHSFHMVSFCIYRLTAATEISTSQNVPFPHPNFCLPANTCLF